MYVNFGEYFRNFIGTHGINLGNTVHYRLASFFQDGHHVKRGAAAHADQHGRLAPLLVQRLGRGADVLFDTVGGEWLLDGLRSLAFNGRMIVVGWAANTGVAAGGGRGGSLSPDQVPTNLIQIKGLTVMGSPMVITGQRDPRGRAVRLAAIDKWVADGVLTPVVSASYPMSALKEAMAARLAGGIVGGCVVRP